ncbi:hypothetical protein [Deinococcus yavapaiensis]|uniref:DUF1190 domain-containing protein n=1 Tax=Deinococcus yavapaiensis KR-236 TaxID=694435 RepID=A0A318SBL7_9DEIO|nr:hypothetical protein [Deinococcus yavapaiensis]PYE56438.1 hypothetical protein DES52_101242 [Deinococcus yavapaiensis KR-236]
MNVKRSRFVGLVLIASVSLTACGSPTSQTRYQYASLQDCLRDWNDYQLCERDGDYGGGYYGHYYGPVIISRSGRTYYRRPGLSSEFVAPSRISSGSTHSIGTRTFTVSRGGFGSSGRSSGS